MPEPTLASVMKHLIWIGPPGCVCSGEFKLFCAPSVLRNVDRMLLAVRTPVATPFTQWLRNTFPGQQTPTAIGTGPILVLPREAIAKINSKGAPC